MSDVRRTFIRNRELCLVIGLLSAFFVLQPLAKTQTILVGQKSSDGHFRFEAAEDLLINQSRKIKLVPASESTLDPSMSKSLERIEISRAGILRGDGKGRLFRVNGASRERVLPETFVVKDAVTVAALQVPLILTVVNDRKSKNFVNVAPEVLYVCISGGEPDLTAQRFVMQPANFSSLDEQLNAMVDFVRSFPGSPGVENLRRDLKARLEAARTDYDGGGSYESLLDAAKISVMAKQAFSSDQELAAVSTEIDSRIQSTTSRIQLLQGLAGLEAWNTFLTAYEDIEIHADSFPELRVSHRRALEEKARMNCIEARALILRNRQADALQRLAIAVSADPNNPQIAKQMENARMLAAQLEAHKPAPSWKPLPKNSPEDRLFRQALYTAQRAIQDHDYAKAQQALREAEAENADAPEVLLVQASLLASANQMSDALPLLDRYDSMVADSSDREKGDTVRNQVLYELQKQKETSHHQIQELMSNGEYSRVFEASTAALKFDATDPEYLYTAALSASVLRKPDEAKVLMDSYLKHSDNLAADDSSRIRVRRLRAVLKEPNGAPEGKGMPNWFSGQKLARDVYYCPLSLAFQVPVQSISGYKFRMVYSWERGRLTAIHTDFEDDKGRQDYATLTSGAVVGKGQQGGTSNGNFTFTYDSSSPSVREVQSGEHKKAAVTNSGNVHLLKNPDGSARLVDALGSAEIVLPNDHLVDTEIVQRLIGPVTTVVSGNSFFNPFIWDGIHYFTLTYDPQGRVLTAKEWNTDNLVRFSWDKQRLKEVTVYRAHATEPYYRRTISYSGDKIAAEEYSTQAHSGRIKYVYAKDVLTSAKVEDGGVHDGKTWSVRLQPEP